VKVLRQFCGLAAALLALVNPAQAIDEPPVQQVTVAGYVFEPFVTETEALTPDLVTLLNESQTGYHFNFIRIPAQRRYRMMAEGRVDAVFFEMPRWGWQADGVAFETTPVLMRDAEIFMARRDKALAPGFFENIHERSIAAVRGFHYRFAGFDSDTATMRRKFNLQFVENQPTVLRLVEQGTVEVGIMARSFLIGEMLMRPELLNNVIVSPDADQVFRLPVIVRKDGAISAAALTSLLQALHDDGRLPHFFAERGLGPLYVWPGQE